MSAKFTTVNRDGYHWLCIEWAGRRIFLHKQARLGDRFAPGQRTAL